MIRHGFRPALTAGLALLMLLAVATQALAELPTVTIPGGTFTPLFGTDPGQTTITVQPFRLDVLQVTNGDFLAFIEDHPDWSPETVDRQFADEQYLAHWSRSGERSVPPQGTLDRPVTAVSWHAADAFCAAQGGRLPTTFEWEFAAAADESRPDARQDPAFVARILAWYGAPFRLASLPAVGLGFRNYYGVVGMHNVVWEWVDDFDSLRFSGAGGRGEGDPSDANCGARAFGAQGVQDYGAFMRFALRGSLQAHYVPVSVGFRCAYAAGR